MPKRIIETLFKGLHQKPQWYKDAVEVLDDVLYIVEAQEPLMEQEVPANRLAEYRAVMGALQCPVELQQMLTVLHKYYEYGKYSIFIPLIHGAIGRESTAASPITKEETRKMIGELYGSPIKIKIFPK